MTDLIDPIGCAVPADRCVVARLGHHGRAWVIAPVSQPMSALLAPVRPFPPRRGAKGSFVYRVVTTTDPKLIGIMYTVTSIGFFMAGGLMALLMRAELAAPGLQFLSNEQYNQLFTMHGTIMLLLYATPIVFGFANCIVPLQIGAPDVAFPRLNALSYWLYLFGALVTCWPGSSPRAVPRTSAGPPTRR